MVVQTVEFDDGAGAVLRIQPLRAPRDENIYECVARNSEGEVSVTAKLAIIRGETPPPSTRPIKPPHFTVHTPGYNRCLRFPELSVVDVTIEPCRTLHSKLQCTVLFIVPQSATERDPATGRAG